MKLDVIPGKNGASSLQVLADNFEDGQRISVVRTALSESGITEDVPGGIIFRLAKVRTAKPKLAGAVPSANGTAPVLPTEVIKLTEAIASMGVEPEPCPVCNEYTMYPPPHEAKNHLHDNGQYCCLLCGEKLKPQGQQGEKSPEAA